MAQSELGPIQFPGLCEVIYARKDVNIADLAAGADAHLNVTVTGALAGDLVLFASGTDVLDVAFSAVVTAADVVTISAINETGDHVNLATAEASILLIRPVGNWATQDAD